MSPPIKVLVVGGGISGLSFTHALKTKLISSGVATCKDRVEIYLVEKDVFLGGWVCLTLLSR